MCEAVAAAQGHRAALACLSSRTRSTSGQRSAVGTLRKLVECESTRRQTIKDIVKAGYDDVVEVVRDPFNPAFDAKEDAVIVLAKCVAHGYGDNAKKNGPDAVKLDVFKRSQALEYCVDHATDRRDDGANMNLREAASAVVREMSELDEVKDAISTREIIRGLVRVMWEEKETATLQCRANACATIFNVCTQSRRKYEEEMRATRKRITPPPPPRGRWRARAWTTTTTTTTTTEAATAAGAATRELLASEPKRAARARTLGRTRRRRRRVRSRPSPRPRSSTRSPCRR